MCRVFKVSRSGYYDWFARKPSGRFLENKRIIKEIKEIFDTSKGRYGSPKIVMELKDRGIIVSRPRVARMMKSASLKSIIKACYRVCTTDSKHSFKISPNILNRNFKVTAPGQVWVSDITYIPTKEGWLYLTIIMDLYDRKIIGWAMSDQMTARETVVAAWQMAILNRPLTGSVIFHSDRGVQYACNEFRVKLGPRVVQSMSRKGNCWDNAVAESFFKILKSETKYHKYDTIRQAKQELFEFIEIWYNRIRKHSYLGYLSPEQFLKAKRKMAA
jgi:putative transposase